MRRFSQVFANIFDPIWLIPVIVVWQMFPAYHETQSLVVPGLLLVTDLIMPGLAYFYYLVNKKFKDWDITRLKYRFPLYLVNTMGQGTGVICSFLLGARQAGLTLGILWLIIFLFMLISLRWKISVHTGINATLSYLLISQYGAGWLWTLGVLVIVAWARVKDRQHTLAQVIAGAGLPLCIIQMMN